MRKQSCQVLTATVISLGAFRLEAGAGAPEPDYGPADGLKLNEEYIPDGEEAFFADAAQRFHKVHALQQQENSKTQGHEIIRRGMHAKGQGCLKGRLTVQNSDPDLAFGLFRNDGMTYEIMARFSNGSGLMQSDHARDLHGLAIKTYGVPGPFIDDAPEPGVQDFLLTSAPVHHAKDAAQLMNFVETQAQRGFKKILFLVKHPGLVLTLLKQTQTKLDSVTNSSYWSRAAFRLGPRQMVKYLAVPCQTHAVKTSDDAEYLTKELATHAESQVICFKFQVQRQLDPLTEPIENYQVEWKTPPQTVAMLQFDRQTPDRSLACENLVYNPWNAAQELQPVGNFNRLRRFVYKAAAAYRQSPQP